MQLAAKQAKGRARSVLCAAYQLQRQVEIIMHAATVALHLSLSGSREGQYWLGGYVWGPNLKPAPKHCRLGDYVWGQSLKPNLKHCRLGDYIWGQTLKPDPKQCTAGRLCLESESKA